MRETTSETGDDEEQKSAPTTPGQAEGTRNINDQSDPSPAPPQTNQAEGEAEDTG